ncbi:hypothetical protein [Aquimarina sp. AU58]|uniref:hypothetical protein n=1 Tax=Aquimarina sp. AU58 TaxID=1874112 RepID=UPI000D642CE3|nr:hypothetical protein [Aquimarina sp. AU58]
MKRVYEIGNDTNQINCTVKIGTVGVAYTAVYIARSGGQWSQIKESTSSSGNIKSFLVGQAIDLRDSYLVIRTIIDFSTIDKDLWNEQKNNIVARYYLKGGLLGAQTYNHDTDDITSSSNGKIVVITKPIKLI